MSSLQRMEFYTLQCFCWRMQISFSLVSQIVGFFSFANMWDVNKLKWVSPSFKLGYKRWVG